MTISERLFNRLVLIGLGVGFLAIVVAGAAMLWGINRNEQHSYWVNHTYEVTQTIGELQILLERSDNSRRGYLISGETGFLTSFQGATREIPYVLDELKRLTGDNASQQRRLAGIRGLVERQQAALERSLATARGGDRARAITEFDEDGSVALIRTLRTVAGRMVAEETALLAQRNETRLDGLRQVYLILVGAAILVLLVAAGSFVVIRSYTRDLSASRNRLASLNENLEAMVDVRTADLQRANEEIQRFAYIVSHDLRSPLVNVMGFTSELEAATGVLTRFVDEAEGKAPERVMAEARVAAREDLPEAIGFIRSSTQKMDRLINAILKLSREGRRTIASEPIDLPKMVKVIGDTLEHRLNESGAELMIEPGLPRITTDRLALEQILSNLIENAVKYLQPGRPGRVTVRGRTERGRAIIEVEDNGRGIDRTDQERIFDLFRRAGRQDQPGEGIGLATVRALVYRLGGSIDCESELDGGAVFRLSLPLVYRAGEGEGP